MESTYLGTVEAYDVIDGIEFYTARMTGNPVARYRGRLLMGAEDWDEIVAWRNEIDTELETDDQEV